MALDYILISCLLKAELSLKRNSENVTTIYYIIMLFLLRHGFTDFPFRYA